MPSVLKEVKRIIVEYHVARRAGHRGLARALQVDVIGARRVQKAPPLLAHHFHFLAGFDADEGKGHAGEGRGGQEVSVWVRVVVYVLQLCRAKHTQ